jgi:hypothetical protein
MRLTSPWIRVLFGMFVLVTTIGSIAPFAKQDVPQLLAEEAPKKITGG